MTKLQADLTKGPKIDTSKPGESAGNAAKYTGGAAIMVFLLGIAVMGADWMRGKFARATGVNTDGSGLGGMWDQI